MGWTNARLLSRTVAPKNSQRCVSADFFLFPLEDIREFSGFIVRAEADGSSFAPLFTLATGVA